MSGYSGGGGGSSSPTTRSNVVRTRSSKIAFPLGDPTENPATCRSPPTFTVTPELSFFNSAHGIPDSGGRNRALNQPMSFA